MKKMQCEVCGGTTIKKIGESLFECQSCGVQYGNEEVQKLLVEIEGTVEVTGTVKVDSNEKTSNLYKLARMAKASNNTQDALKYYEMILIEEPESWEATLYSSVYKAYQGTIGSIANDALTLKDKIPSVLVLIKNSAKNDEDLYSKCLAAYTALYGAYNMLSSAATNTLKEKYNKSINASSSSIYDNQWYSKHCSECMERLYCAYSILSGFGDSIEVMYHDKQKLMELALGAWGDAIKENRAACNLTDSSPYVEIYNEDYKKYQSKVDTIGRKFLRLTSEINNFTFEEMSNNYYSCDVARNEEHQRADTAKKLKKYIDDAFETAKVGEVLSISHANPAASVSEIALSFENDGTVFISISFDDGNVYSKANAKKEDALPLIYEYVMCGRIEFTRISDFVKLNFKEPQNNSDNQGCSSTLIAIAAFVVFFLVLFGKYIF